MIIKTLLSCVPRNTTGEYLSLDTNVTTWVTVSTTKNERDWLDFVQAKEKALLITRILECIIALVGLAGNAVVLWLLGFRMQRNAFSVYILNLAAADFVFLSIWMTLSIRAFFPGLEFKFSYGVERLRKIFSFPYIASLSILTAISTERCLSVLKPIWYYSHRPKYLSAVVCALIWALSLLLSILRMKFCDYPSGMYDKYLCDLTDLSIAVWLVLCSVLLFVSSLALLTRLLCGSWKLKLTRLYVTISLTVLVFLICGLPWGINLFLKPSTTMRNRIHILRFRLATQVLSCVSSCANPIIYFFVGFYRKQEKLQRRLKIILQRALQDIPEENGSEGRPPQETPVIS
ncbi:mas-related G-protein coupled receptor member X4 [Sorex araneus]|uniref:mas-related G-protein coupled receptor member X4 n=1 Tax=Sorex araneus TaxID=42254 RepID=UPI00243384D3|nr:mas-related G-protein coupled receptor member X4 [Sorex araneus]